MIVMFINKYSVLAFSMILACLQAATEQDQLDIALALSKAEHEAELKRNDDSMALQRAIEEQNIQKALQDDLETRNSKAAAGYHENEDPELQQAIAESMKKPAATAGHYENEDPELQRAIAESMKKPAAGTSGGTAEDIVRESRLKHFSSSARSSRAPLSEADLEARVESQFQKEKREIEIEIQGLEEMDVNTTVTIVKDRPKRRSEINARLYVLRNQLQHYTIPGKITAKKMQIKAWIAAQR